MIYAWLKLIFLGGFTIENILLYPNVFHDIPHSLEITSEFLQVYWGTLLFFTIFKGNPQGKELDLFIGLRFIGMLIILIITNGLLTYFVSKSIINSIKRLSYATRKISEDDLDFSVASNKKDEIGGDP